MKKMLAVALALLPMWVVAQQLTVAAAASLTDAFKEIGPRFEAAHPGSSVRFNFAASGVLLQQIVQGAPVDVWASADPETVQRGIDAKVLDAATKRDFAANTLVMVVPAQGGPSLSALADLARPEVKRIAIGKVASVPAGRYAKEVLDNARLSATLEPKLVHADNVRQVLDYVARGEADAGFVYRTDAALMKDKVRIVLTASGAPVTYPVVLVADGRQRALATAFADFLIGAEARAILARHGFGKP